MSSSRSPRKSGNNKSSGRHTPGDSTPSALSPSAATSSDRALRGGGGSDDEQEDYFDAMGDKGDRMAAAADPATEDFPDHVEALTDSAASKRTKALQSILKLLRSGVDYSEYLLGFRDRLTESLVWILKRQVSESEAVLAAQIIALFALVLGADDDEYVEAVSDTLKIAITRSSFEAVRVWSMVAFSLVCLICSSLSNVAAWEFCADVFCEESEALPPSPRLRAAAADAWVLLGDTVSGAAVLSQSRVRVFSALVDLLEETSTEVKISAGECLGFLWETALDSGLEGGEQAPSGESAEELALRLLSEDSETVSRALDVLNSTAKESSKKVSKKDRKEQRGAFREFCDFILDGSFPVDQVRMSGAVIEVDTFARRRVLETLKLALGDGFQTGLRAFPVLRGVLGVDFFAADFMDGDGGDVRVDKNSARDKQRTAFRQQERRLREILKEY